MLMGGMLGKVSLSQVEVVEALGSISMSNPTLCDGADSAMNFNKGVNSSVLWEGSDKAPTHGVIGSMNVKTCRKEKG